MIRSTDISPLSVLLSRVDAASDGAAPRDVVATGFPSIDKMLGGGFRRGDLVVLGGDVGVGKSALALAISLRASVRHSTLFVSTEALPERIHERALAIEGRARIDDLRLGSMDETTRINVGTAAVALRNRLPRIERAGNGGLDGLGSLLDGATGTELVVLDCLQGLAGGAQGVTESAATTILGLKHLALSRQVAILTTAQLPGLTSRADRRPTLDDFGAMGAVKHHADVVLTLFREEMYEESRDIAGATELLVRKNRHGRTGYIDLYFYSQWLRFEDMLDPDR